MKKKIKIIELINKSKYKKIIYISLVLVLLAIVVLLLFLFLKDDEQALYDYYDEKNSNIVVSKTQKEKPGTLIRNIETLKEKHCKDDICISNVIIYYIKDEGRIEYKITNNSKKKASGAFKVKFDNDKVTYIVYSKLKKGESRDGVISFSGVDLSNVYDYSLKKLKDDELKKLLNSK